MALQAPTQLLPEGQEGPVAALSGGAGFSTAGALAMPLATAVAPSSAIDPGGRRSRGLARVTATRLLVRLADALAGTAAVAVVLGATPAHDRGWFLALAAPLIVLLCKLLGTDRSHELRIARSTVDDLPQLLHVSGLFALLITIGESLLHGVALDSWQILGLWGASFLAIVIGRVGARSLARYVLVNERCMLIADLRQSKRLRARLEASGAGLSVVGALELTPEDIAALQGTSTIHDLVSEMDVHRIILAPGFSDGAGDLVRMAKASGVSVSLLPGIFNLVGSTVEFDEVNGISLVGVQSFGISRASRLVKRTFDLITATIGVILVAPVLVAITAAIKLDSEGPVFFRQTRVGRDGKRFMIIKFRSMVTDAEAQKERLKTTEAIGEGLFKLHDDPRVTRVGRLLRRSSIDELPQVFNVLRGDMSLVGPRPLIEEEDSQIVGLDRSRLHLLPGITGPWQVLRTRVGRDEMIELDYRYAAHWSLWLDLKILLRTAAHVARRGNI